MGEVLRWSARVGCWHDAEQALDDIQRQVQGARRGACRLVRRRGAIAHLSPQALEVLRQLPSRYRYSSGGADFTGNAIQPGGGDAGHWVGRPASAPGGRTRDQALEARPRPDGLCAGALAVPSQHHA